MNYEREREREREGGREGRKREREKGKEPTILRSEITEKESLHLS